jgi:hypothetical protein
VDRHEVRAADALPLAAALEWCEGIPQGRVFLAADQKLSGDSRSQRIRRETGLESSPYGEILHRPDYYRPAQHSFQQMAFGGDGLGCGAAGGVALGGDYQGFVLR